MDINDLFNNQQTTQQVSNNTSPQVNTPPNNTNNVIQQSPNPMASNDPMIVPMPAIPKPFPTVPQESNNISNIQPNNNIQTENITASNSNQQASAQTTTTGIPEIKKIETEAPQISLENEQLQNSNLIVPQLETTKPQELLPKVNNIPNEAPQINLNRENSNQLPPISIPNVELKPNIENKLPEKASIEAPVIQDDLMSKPLDIDEANKAVINPNIPKTDLSSVVPKIIENNNQNTTQVYPFNIKNLFEMVIDKNASDLHITSGYSPMIRVDGDLQVVNSITLTEYQAKELIYSTLDEEQKEIVEVNKELDFAYNFDGKAKFRVNVFHASGKLSAAYRLIPTHIRTIEELKLPRIYYNFINLRQGLILITGPTGHGKSTTLAAILNEINKTRPVHIVTIEDPIEYVYPKEMALVEQREIKSDTHGWDIALRSILRQDPDVVLIGEMRDYETIAAAITVAETGHLVFATLHTNSASQTIDRIVDVFPEHQQEQVRIQLASVLEAVVSQRLVKLTQGGRRAVSEVMLGTSAVKNLIRENKAYQLDNVIRTNSDLGMMSIEKSLVDLIREGVLNIEDAQNYAINPEEIIRLLK